MDEHEVESIDGIQFETFGEMVEHCLREVRLGLQKVQLLTDLSDFERGIR